jgi:O-methyltransferase domain/Dimerisation domain
MDQKSVLLARKKMMSLLGTQALPMHAIAVAADLGIADLVEEQPQTPEELAAKIGANADALGRMLKALNTMGIFEEDANGRQHNTPLSATLRNDIPGSMVGWARYKTSEMTNRTFEGLRYSVVTGQPVFPKIFGKSLFAFLGENPEMREVFAGGMTSYSSSSVSEAVEAYDFSRIKRIADIGGGHGAFLRGILSAVNGPTGILLDLPEVIAQADKSQAAALGDRYSVVAGDFFKAVPPQADLYLMRHIIHNWSDQDAVTIFCNCRKAMAPGGKVLIIEFLLKEANQPDFGRFMDLTMLTFVHGRERTLTEFESIFQAGNLRLTRAIPTSGLHTLIEAEAA